MYQQELGDQFNVKYGSEKLCLTLYDKKKYIWHYRNLKFYLSLAFDNVVRDQTDYVCSLLVVLAGVLT